MPEVTCTIPYYKCDNIDNPDGIMRFSRGWGNALPDFFVTIEVDGKKYKVTFRDFWASAKSCASLGG